MKLGINIDHVATIRQARGTRYPSPIQAALLAEAAGADAITLHLREDRRHIQDRDVEILRELLTTRMNLEMAVTDEMIEIATHIKPHDVCLVPERREELTTEGGLNVSGNFEKIRRACNIFKDNGIRVSLFVDAEPDQLESAARAGAPVIEIHTGHYANTVSALQLDHELERIQRAAKIASSLGLQVNAGHGLDYHNVYKIAAVSEIEELNIGHAVVAHAVFVGWERAVREMKNAVMAPAL